MKVRLKVLCREETDMESLKIHGCWTILAVMAHGCVPTFTVYYHGETVSSYYRLTTRSLSGGAQLVGCWKLE